MSFHTAKEQASSSSRRYTRAGIRIPSIFASTIMNSEMGAYLERVEHIRTRMLSLAVRPQGESREGESIPLVPISTSSNPLPPQHAEDDTDFLVLYDLRPEDSISNFDSTHALPSRTEPSSSGVGSNWFLFEELRRLPVSFMTDDEWEDRMVDWVDGIVLPDGGHGGFTPPSTPSSDGMGSLLLEPTRALEPEPEEVILVYSPSVYSQPTPPPFPFPYGNLRPSSPTHSLSFRAPRQVTLRELHNIETVDRLMNSFVMSGALVARDLDFDDLERGLEEYVEKFDWVVYALEARFRLNREFEEELRREEQENGKEGEQ